MSQENQTDFIGVSAEDVEQALLQDTDVPENSKPCAKLLNDLMTMVEQKMIGEGRNPKEAHKLARLAIYTIAEYGGGRTLYLSKVDKLKQEVRSREIFKEFNGHNVAELCKKYNLTERWIYQIIKEQRSLHIKRNQPDLFQ